MTRPCRMLLALGFATVVGQTVLLREGMAMLGGSEFAWGVVLLLWLVGMGAGARLGVGVGRPARGAYGPILVLVLAGAGVILLKAAPTLAGATPGEVGFGWRSTWIWAGAVLPAAMAGGWAFPVLAAALRQERAAAASYALEACGALLGGVTFTFVLARFGSPAAVMIAGGIVGALALMSRRWWPAGLAVVVVAVAAAVPVAGLVADLGWALSRHGGALGGWRETRQQRLEFTPGPPAAVFADGRLLASQPPAYGAAARAHLLALLHPAPNHILAIGGLGDGTLRRLLDHPLVRLDFIEDDPALVGVLSQWFGAPVAEVTADPRVRVFRTDPLRVIGGGGGWDLILLLDGDPTTIRRNRTRTLEFFRSCARGLNDGGFLIVRVGASDTYLGGTGGRLLASLATTLMKVFPVVEAMPGDEVLLVACTAAHRPELDAARLGERWVERGIVDAEAIPEVLPLLLDPPRAVAVQSFIDTARAEINRTDLPRALLPAAGLHGGRDAGGLLVVVRRLAELPRLVFFGVVAALAILLICGGLIRSRPSAGAGFVVGFSSMGWWLLLLAMWQATEGSVYAEVGALSAAFMCGVALGAVAGRHRATGGGALSTILFGGALFSMVLASPVPLRWPLATIIPLLLAGGVLTGAAFPGVAAILGEGNERRGAGRGFAADEAGAGLAAVGIGLVALPWVGMRDVAVALAILCMGAATGLALAAWRRDR